MAQYGHLCANVQTWRFGSRAWRDCDALSLIKTCDPLHSDLCVWPCSTVMKDEIVCTLFHKDWWQWLDGGTQTHSADQSLYLLAKPFILSHLNMRILCFTTLPYFQPIISSTWSEFTVHHCQLVMTWYAYMCSRSSVFRARMPVIGKTSDSNALGTISVTDWPHTVRWFRREAALWEEMEGD